MTPLLVILGVHVFLLEISKPRAIAFFLLLGVGCGPWRVFNSILEEGYIGKAI